MTLRTESFRKMYLNHRNSLLMLVRNYGWRSLLTVLPARGFLELVTVLGALLTGNVRRAAAAAFALPAAVLALPRILPERRQIQRMRRSSDAEVGTLMFQGSIALWYLFRRRSPVLGERA
jgi:hypothetical protein